VLGVIAHPPAPLKPAAEQGRRARSIAARRRARRQPWALTTRLYIALASMAALASVTALLFGGMRTG
jgi:hypothetical protein